MKKLMAFILSALLIFSFVTTSTASGKFCLTKKWSYAPGESSLQEKWIYHITKKGYAVYLMGNGEGYAKMLTLSPNGKKVWDKELGHSFVIGEGTVSALYKIENGQITKYDLNSGNVFTTISAPVKDTGSFELFGVSTKNTLYVFDFIQMKIFEINDEGKVLSSYNYTDEEVKKLSIQKPNMQNWDRQPPEKVTKALKRVVPNFIKDKKSFERKYGKGAKYYPYFISKKHGSTVYVLGSYQINSTKPGLEIYSHSVMFKFSKAGKYLSQKDLGDYYGRDIDISTKGNVYVSMNKLNASKPYGVIKVINKKNQTLKHLKYSTQIIDGKMHDDKLYVVTGKYFYMYK